MPPPSVAAGWGLTLYPEAGEAGGSFRYAGRPPPRVLGVRGEGDRGRTRLEAARRAREKVRRYAAANGLSRLWGLTYAGAGVYDADEHRANVTEFFRDLRAELGGKPLPYVWVPEWHKRHGLHAHFALGRYVHWSVVRGVWGRGSVHAKLLSDLPVAATGVQEARVAARYLSKYIAKTFEHDGFGRHRYEVAQGFQPRSVRLLGRTVDEVLDRASEQMQAEPDYLWSSDGQPGWEGPPALWVSWRG